MPYLGSSYAGLSATEKVYLGKILIYIKGDLESRLFARTALNAYVLIVTRKQ